MVRMAGGRRNKERINCEVMEMSKMCKDQEA